MKNSENKAWVTFNTPLSQSELFNFCLNIEQLFRINPYLEILNWDKLDTKKYFIHLINHSQNPEFSIESIIYVSKFKYRLLIQYEKGIKSDTSLLVEETLDGSKLTITENYQNFDAEIKSFQINKVDKSLTKWAEEIQHYLIGWQNWSWCLPWKFYKQFIWLPMKPPARRISYMLIWISMVEVTLIFLGICIYFLEFR